MPRTADYTILGFLYQFNKTLIEVLNAPADATVTVEGIVEDIDISQPDHLTAIQCKYHEAQSTFNLSVLYKPILQMMDHFRRNSDHDIRYRLYAHFATEKQAEQPVTQDQLNQVLSTTDARLAPLAASIKDGIDVGDFQTRFVLEFGPSFDELASEAQNLMKKAGLPEADIETLLYPNALHQISLIASRHDVAQRQVTKDAFLGELLDIRKTAISRWTLALKTRKSLLAARRTQLEPCLKQNTRLRYFLLSQDDIEDFGDGIVVFLSDYLAKFHFKSLHLYTPVFCFDCPQDLFVSICRRAHQKGIKFTDGIVAGEFAPAHFLRAPITRQDKSTGTIREFDIRLLHIGNSAAVLNQAKSDDFFVASSRPPEDIDVQDVNLEVLEVSTLKELKYLLRMSNAHE